jgi:hypothetical protein
VCSGFRAENSLSYPLYDCFDSGEVVFVFRQTANELKNQRDVSLARRFDAQ